MSNKYVNMLERQLAIDYDCTVAEVHSNENVYRILKVKEGARPIGNADTLLKIAVYRESEMV